MLFFRHPHPFAKLRALVDLFWLGNKSLSHGHDVLKELPGDLTGNPARNIIVSAMAIKLALFGMSQPIPFARHILGLISVCCYEVSLHGEQSFFAESTFVLAEDAYDYAFDRLSL